MKKETYYEEQGLTKKEFHERESLLNKLKYHNSDFTLENHKRLTDITAKMNFDPEDMKIINANLLSK